MYSQDEIQKKALSLYRKWLQQWLVGESFTLIDLSAGKRPKTYVKIRDETHSLKKYSKDAIGYGYRIEFQTVRTREFSDITVPRRLIFDTLDDLLRYVKKVLEFEHFANDVAMIREAMPVLEEWLLTRPQKVIDHHGEWQNLLHVCQYFIDNPHPNLYIRELPVQVHTKFIETHTGILRELLDAVLPVEAYNTEEATFTTRYGLRDKSPLVRVRYLDDQMRHHDNMPFSEFSAPVRELQNIKLSAKRILIVENEINFLTLPPLKNTIALWGAGFKVSVLREIDWLGDLEMLYWGDIDAQGFQILSQLRSNYLQVQSLMMDRHTLERFSAYAVEGTATSIMNLPHLTLEEQVTFAQVQEHNLRLEQEHIPQSYVLDALHKLFRE